MNLWVHIRSPATEIQYYIKDMVHVPVNDCAFANRFIFQQVPSASWQDTVRAEALAHRASGLWAPACEGDWSST
eukprot:9412034-Heterocapsa_arctica.AAC.1